LINYLKNYKPQLLAKSSLAKQLLFTSKLIFVCA